MQMLDQRIQKFWPPGEEDTTSPTCARIRALWSKCNTISYILSNTSSSNFPSNSSIYTYTFNYDFLIKLARKPSTEVKSRRYDDYEDPIWEKPSRRNTWLSLNSFSTTLVLGSPTQDQQGNQIYPYPTSIVPWSRLDHPNHFVVRSRFYRNSAGTTHQRWTSTQPASLVIGSTEPLPSFAMPTYYVECATYKYSKPLMPRLQSTPLSNLMQNWGWDMSLLKSSSKKKRVLQCGQEDLECYCTTLFPRLVDI